jgi:MFS superfamily sulfate permease-like transporter
MDRPISRTTRRIQVALVALGIALLVVGGIVLWVDVAPSDYPGLLVWLAGSLVLHDGVLAVIVVVVSLVLRRTGKRIPFAVLLIAQGAVVVAAITTLIAFPQVIKQGMGTTNPTVLPLDYGANLLWLYAILAVVTAVTVIVYLRVHARRHGAVEGGRTV